MTPRRLDYTPGDPADFQRLITKSYGKILATLILMLADRQAAEDCTQAAFENAFRNWSKWKPTAPAEAWLHRIAINIAISHLRHAKLGRVDELIRRIGAPEHHTRSGEDDLHNDLMIALAQLPPKQVVAIVLRHYHGYSNRAISAALGVPECTVASRIIVARRKLRELLPDYAPRMTALKKKQGPDDQGLVAGGGVPGPS